MTTTAPSMTSTQLGYARVSTDHQSLDQQLDALSAAGVDPKRVYSDKLSGTSTREQRPGLAALLDYARPGDAIVVVGIDRLAGCAIFRNHVWHAGIDEKTGTVALVSGDIAQLIDLSALCAADGGGAGGIELAA